MAVFESINLLIKARLKIDKNAVSRGFLSLIARAARPSAAGGGKYVQRWECPMSAYLVPSQPPSPHQALFTLRPAHLPPPLNGEFRRHVPLALLLGSCEAAREPKKQPLLAGCELTLR